MIKGMTGFGQAQLSVGKIKALVEIKSVNHRYLDISFYLPIGFSSVESKVRQLIQQECRRGRVTVAIKITQKPPQAVTVNKDTVKAHLHYANQLKKEFKLKNDLTLSDLIRLPGVVEIKEVLVNPQESWPGLEKCLKRALGILVQMRKREGRSLAKDLTDQLKHMLLESKKIQLRCDKILKEKKKTLNNDEFKAFQKGCDINEEISRLSHYIGELKLLLRNKKAVGKQMDFIAQEMQRETNTIGSKVQDSHVANAVIMIKSKVEKIREQAQNVE